MKSKFKKENKRKSKQFEAWMEYLDEVYDHLGINGEEDFDQFEEIYEGYAQISSLSKKFMSLKLDGKRVVRYVPISQKLRHFIHPTDHFSLVLGKVGKCWWPIELVMIGSEIQCGDNKPQMHLTVNSMYENFFGEGPMKSTLH